MTQHERPHEMCDSAPGKPSANCDDVADQLEATLPGYALPVGEGGFGVWGGTSRTDTFYAPTNFGIHFHDEADDSYMDDGFRVCADVDTVTGLMEEDYQDWLWTFMQDGSYAALLGG